MERMYTVEVRAIIGQVIIVLKDPYGEKEYVMTSEHALQLSMTLATAVEHLQEEQFKKLPRRVVDCKQGQH